MNKPLLILDLDETLVHGSEYPLELAFDFEVGGYGVYLRPFLQQFLDAVSLSFELAVWSSASGPYVRAIAERIFPDPATLTFVWSRERCTRRFDVETSESYWMKNLDKLKRRGYSLAQVVMIDDSPEALARHHGNHLQLTPFQGQADDSDLRDVLPFLEWLREAENFRAVDKRRWREFVRRPSSQA